MTVELRSIQVHIAAEYIDVLNIDLNLVKEENRQIMPSQDTFYKTFEMLNQ